MTDSFLDSDEYYMSRAIALAKRGLYTTMPNPRVGCVLVNHGAVVGEGWHQHAGEAHAEINALHAAGDKARGATAYVTLEPCSHYGRTGPCADALVEAGITRLVVGMRDTNPQVGGHGIARCQEAGMEVRIGVCEAAAQELNPGFVSRMSRHRPYVRLKMASSLDGRTAMASGESQWITGPAARRDVQRTRARSSAVVTGVDTLILDDSRLTVRPLDSGLGPDQIGPQPLRVIIDSRLRTPLAAKLLREEGRTLIVTRHPDEKRRIRLEAAGAEVLVQPMNAEELEHYSTDGSVPHVDLEEMLRYLAEHEQCNEVLVETGARLAGAMFKAQLADELIVYLAPTLMGSRARPLLDLDISMMDEQQHVVIKDIRAVGDDWRITVLPRMESPC